MSLDAAIAEAAARAVAVELEPMREQLEQIRQLLEQYLGGPVLLRRDPMAERLGISTPTLDRLRAIPGFPETRAGDVPLFDPAEVIPFVKKLGEAGR